MFQHQKLVCGGLFVFFTTASLGCAGNGVKNLFSRNSTDGYHTLEELESKDRMLAKDEEPEEKTPSLSSKLTSWRPFSKPEKEAEEAKVADSGSTDKKSAESPRSTRVLGLPLEKRDAVEPDPFLGSDTLLTENSKTPSKKTDPEPKSAETGSRPKGDIKTVAYDSTQEPASRTSAATKDSSDKADSKTADLDSAAIAKNAEPKSNAVSSDDDALAKRFEQHFLLNSVGTVARTESTASETEKALQQKTEATKSAVATKRRDVVSIAERQLDGIDQLLAADNVLSAPRSTLRSKVAKPTEASSLAAFDRLLGTEGTASTKPAAEPPAKQTQTVAKTAVKQPTKSNASTEIRVADTEALFGSAAARQQARLSASQRSAETSSHEQNVARAGAWSQNPAEDGEFGWGEKSFKGALSNQAAHQIEVPAGGQNSLARTGRNRNTRTGFGAPAASAGNVNEVELSAVETAHARFENGFDTSATQRILTANFGTTRPGTGVRPVSSQQTITDTTFMATAPVTPVVDAPAAGDEATTGRSGLLQSLSARNWLLLIGGIIIIALLFAPGRTKPVAMNG